MGTRISESNGMYSAPTREEVTTMPSTRRSAKDWTTFRSRSGSALELARKTEYPGSLHRSSIPSTTSLTNGSAMEVTTTPIVLVRYVTSPRATALARYPDSRAIFWIFSAVRRLINGLFCKALETVEKETLAFRAISLMEVGRYTGSVVALLHTFAERQTYCNSLPSRMSMGGDISSSTANIREIPNHLQLIFSQDLRQFPIGR